MAARSVVSRLLADRSGATAIEYGLILSLIFLVVVTAMTSFGNSATTMFNYVSSTIVSHTS
jgi:pilus assembly protein Flp/PilA